MSRLILLIDGPLHLKWWPASRFHEGWARLMYHRFGAPHVIGYADSVGKLPVETCEAWYQLVDDETGEARYRIDTPDTCGCPELGLALMNAPDDAIIELMQRLSAKRKR